MKPGGLRNIIRLLQFQNELTGLYRGGIEVERLPSTSDVRDLFVFSPLVAFQLCFLRLFVFLALFHTFIALLPPSAKTGSVTPR